MTFIFVSLIYDPTNKSAEDDRTLAELSMLQLQKYFDYKGLEKFKQLRHVLVQIEGMAKSVLKNVRSSRSHKAGAQPKPAFGSTFLPSVSSPPVDVFDVSFGQNLVSSSQLPACLLLAVDDGIYG